MRMLDRPVLVRVVLASISNLALLGLRQLLELMPDVEITDVVDSRSGLNHALRRCIPDVVVMDPELFSAAERIPELNASRILLLSPRAHAGMLPEGLVPCGFLSERCDLEQVRAALRTVIGCDGPTHDRARCGRCPLAPSLGSSQPLPLSRRETQIFSLIGQGLGTSAIATVLRRSVKTVEAHRENIKRKLGLGNAMELVDAARRWSRGEDIHSVSY